MKYYLTLISSILLMAGTASAQNVNLGLKGGLNVYEIQQENGTDYKTKAGFNIGLLGHIHLTDRFALQPELLYSAQGAQYTVNNTDTKINLHYVNVPVLLQFMFDNGFRIQAGPQLGVLASAKSRTNDMSIDIKDSFNTIDLGVSLGLSYVHPPSGFGVDGRYNIGLSDISENATVKSTNRGLQFGVFYLINHRSI